MSRDGILSNSDVTITIMLMKLIAIMAFSSLLFQNQYFVQIFVQVYVVLSLVKSSLNASKVLHFLLNLSA
jgi:hypothetical protein